MSLGHRPVLHPPNTEKSAALGGPLDSAAAMIRSRDGPALRVQSAPFSVSMLSFEGWEIAAPDDASPEPERSGFSSRVEPDPWSDTPTNDPWDPPTTRSQHLRQQVVAIALAFILATLLSQIGL